MGKAVTWALFIILLQIYSTAGTPNDEMISWDYLSLYDCVYDPHHDDNSQHIDVAQDGTADHTTVQAAINSIPARNSWRVKIFIRAGIYREKVNIPSNKSHISFIGDGIGKTILTWNDNASSKGPNGKPLGTIGSASTTIESTYFCAKGITFENTAPAAPPGAKDMQAVALRVAGDKALFIDCQMVGHQDTLYDHLGRHFFWRCFIEGSIDFICGNARSLYKDCLLISNAESWGAVAASQSLPNETTGFSFVDCNVTGSGSLYLGRAWSEYSTIIYSYCRFDNIIDPLGWDDMKYPSRRSTAMFGEYNCGGRGANKNCTTAIIDAERRGAVPWANCFLYDRVQPYLSLQYIDGQDWLKI